MTKDFLLLSPTYRRKTNPEVLRRRTFILQYVKAENYKLRRGSRKTILASAKDAGIKMNSFIIAGDVSVIRTAFRFLKGDEGVRKSLEEQKRIRKRQPAFVAVNYLVKDGITTWEQILELESQSKPTSPIAEKSDGEDIELSKISQLNLLDNFANATVGLAKLIESLLKENREFREESVKLQEALKQQLRNTAALNEQMNAISVQRFERFARLEEATVAKPEHISKLLGTIEGIKESLVPSAVPKEFPKRCPNQENAVVHYEGAFLKTFHRLTRYEKIGVEKALKLLCTYGTNYNSLQTKKLLSATSRSSIGSFQSRISREIRFNWKKDSAGSIIMLEILRRGDTGYSEA